MNEQNPNYLLDTDKICNYFKEQLNSFEKLIEEKFERVFDNQNHINDRLDKGDEAFKELRKDLNVVENELIELRTEKDSDRRNTRLIAIGIGIVLAAIEVYILFSK